LDDLSYTQEAGVDADGLSAVLDNSPAPNPNEISKPWQSAIDHLGNDLSNRMRVTESDSVDVVQVKKAFARLLMRDAVRRAWASAQP
jgi:hypothetical protein